MDLTGIILSGGPASVYDKERSDMRRENFRARRADPRHLLWNAARLQNPGCQSRPSKKQRIRPNKPENHMTKPVCSRTSRIQQPSGQATATRSSQLTNDFIKLAHHRTCPFAAVRHKRTKFYGVQFHPEVAHTPKGRGYPAKFPLRNLQLHRRLENERFRRLKPSQAIRNRSAVPHGNMRLQRRRRFIRNRRAHPQSHR